MKVLLIFALAGLACGLQPDVEYVYQYFGKVDTGIPEISHEGASVALKADIRVVVHGDGHAHFKFENPMFAEYQGDLGCYERADLPFEFLGPPTPEIEKAVSEIYEANLYGTEDFALSLQHDEPLWLTNMRKAVTSLFRNSLLKVNFDIERDCSIFDLMKKGETPESFTVVEDSVFGRCNVDYTFHPVPDVMGIPHLAEVSRVEVDQQLGGPASSSLKTKKGPSKTRKTSKSSKITSKLPFLDDQLWHVVKTIDFEHCELNVGFQTSNCELFENIGDGQRAWFSGRSVLGEYLLRGSYKGYRIEMAAVEDSYTTLAAGLAKELLQQRTNQTLHLVSVKEVHTQIPEYVPEKTITTWQHEIITPTDAPTVSPAKPYLIYAGKDFATDPMAMLTGIKDTDDSVVAKKNLVHTFLTQAAQTFTSDKDTPDVKDGETAGNLYVVSMLLMGLPKKTLLELKDEIMVDNVVERSVEKMKKKLFVDTLAASGTLNAGEVVTDLAKEEKISDLQKVTLCMTLTSNTKDVRVFPHLIDFVTSVDPKKKPFLASICMVNVANAFHHFCIDPHAATNHYAGEFYGNTGCDVTYAKDNLIPYLKKAIYNEDLTWERLAAIKALNRLRISSSADILAPIILGKKGQSTILRVKAIFALERWNLPIEIKGNVIDLLTRIYSDVSEMPRVRIAALVTLTSYGPKTSFWYRIAKLTWREPSLLVSSAYTSIIKAFAETAHPYFVKQNQAATHALRLAKPSTYSAKYPFVIREVTNIYDEHLLKIQSLGLAMYDFYAKNVNFDLYYFLMNSFNGFSFTNAEVILSGGEFGDLQDTQKTTYEPTTTHHKVAEQFVAQVQKVINVLPKEHPQHRIATIFLRFFDSVQAFLPFSAETISALPFHDPAYFGSLMLNLQTGMNIVLGKYMVPFYITAAAPNGLGLPLIESHVTSLSFGNKAYTHVTVGSQNLVQKPNKLHVDVENFFRLETVSSFRLSVLIPWTSTVVSSSVKTTRDVKLPLEITANFERKSESHPAHIEFSVKPLFDTEFSVVSGATTPEVLFEPMNFVTKPRPVQKITLTKHKPIHQHYHLPKNYAGMDLSFDWNSQFRHPFNMFDFQRMLPNIKRFDVIPKLYYALSTRTAEQWSFALKMDPSKSETKNITFSGACQHYGDDSAPYTEGGQETQSSGQTYYDQVEFGQEQSFDVEQEFGQSPESSEESHEFGYTNQQRAEKIQAHYGGNARSCNLKVDFHGTKHREYEILYSWSKPVYANFRKQYKSQLSFFRGPVPGLDPKPLAVCLDTQKTTPTFSDLDTPDSILKRETSLDTEIVREVRVGCGDSEPVLRMETNLKYTPAGLKALKERTEGCCKFDKFDPMAGAFHGAVYDDVKTEITWENVCNKAKLPLLSKFTSLLEKTFMKGFYNVGCGNDDKPNHLYLTAHRDPETQLWNYAAKRGDEESHLDYVETCSVSKFLFSVANHVDMKAHRNYVYGQAKISERCSVALDNVRTFDGKVFNFQASQCWTVLALDGTTHRWVVLGRKPATESTVPEVRIIERSNGVVVDIGKQVKVNGKVVDPENFKEVVYSEGKLIAKVFKQDGHFMVKLPHVVKVAVKNRVEIRLLDDEEEVLGVCGDHNNEKVLEFSGPQRCIFTNAEAFAAAWTGGGETCDLYEQEAIRSKAEKAQKGCLKVRDLSTFLNEKHRPLHYHYSWSIHHEQDLVCISSWMHAECDEGYFSPCQFDDVNAEFKCWNKSRAPEFIVNAVAEGKSRVTQVANERPLKFIHRHIKVPRNCAAH